MQCSSNAELFCYVCGNYTTKSERRNLTAALTDAYHLYFGFPVQFQDQDWVPKFCCTSCSSKLHNWYSGRGGHLPFAVPMIWTKPMSHPSDCYFCLMPSHSGLNKKKKAALVYPSLSSARRPILRDDSMPLPISPNASPPIEIDDEDDDNFGFFDNLEQDPDYEAGFETKLPDQAMLNDLCRRLKLDKTTSEILVSTLVEWNVVADGVRSSSHRDRDRRFSQFFVDHEGYVSCEDINGLMVEMGIAYNANDWYLFVDSGKDSLKFVLLSKSGSQPAIPVAYSHSLNESYSNLKLLFEKVKYQEHQWIVCSDFKVVVYLMGMQQGYVKFGCYLCTWNSRDRAHHYITKVWPIRESLSPGQHNVINEPIVDPQNIILPPLHIRLGLGTNFIKKLDFEGPAFLYLVEKFKSQVSEAKLKAGVLNGPQLRSLLSDERFPQLLGEVELVAWRAFKAVSENFLGNHRSENYVELVDTMMTAYQAMGVNMSLKVHVMHSHLDHFASNCGKMSDEHGERFHQEMAPFERRFQGKWNARMLGEFCWSRVWDDPQAEDEHKRQVKRIRVH